MVKWDQHAMEFLDVYIFKDSNGYLQMDMYRKTTSDNSLVHANSSHPAPTKKGIPTGQFTRARSICSTDELFFKQAHDLTSRFQERGYNKDTIQKA